MTGSLALMLAQVAGRGGSFWMPPPGSTTAAGVDRVFYFIFWVSVFFFALIVALTLAFVVRYRRRAGHVETKTATHNTALELTWSIIPLVLVAMMFYLGAKQLIVMTTAPPGAMEVQVIARRWNWLFKYPNGYVDADLHVPVDKAVILVMSSEDVIHSFGVPDFRLKQDLVPGRYSKAWFQATKPGEHLIYCTEYCGTGHSDMAALVVVHEPGGYEAWLAKASSLAGAMPPEQIGERLYKVRGCAQCHSLDGRRGTGPTFKGLFGSQRPLSKPRGETVVADENYIRESLLEPQAKVVAGFDAVMSTYRGQLNDDDIAAVIAYLKTLSDVPATQSAPDPETTETSQVAP